jgi:carbamoyl-phosphate synthase large subunit
MAKPSINILMTGAGAPGAAGIIHCLKQESHVHITSADANDEAIGRYLSNDFEKIPFAEETNFIDSLLSLCRRKNIHVLLPLVTKELLPVAKHSREFELAGVRIPVSPAASLEIANNKGSLYQFLQWRSIPVPDFRIVENPDQFISAVQELGYPGKPICFKPTVSNGSRGFRIITDHIDELDLLFNQKPTAAFIQYKEALRLLASGEFPQLIVSEYLPGEEYSVDCLGRYGESILVLPRVRKKIINGITVEGEFIKEDDLISYCSTIIRELQLHGNIGIQARRSATGEFRILEINPRVQGTISSALGAGVNLPLLAIKQELGLPIEENELHVKWGTRFSRHWTEVFY